jgi:two-component system response regulator
VTHGPRIPENPYIFIAEDNAGDVSLIRLALSEQGIAHELAVQPDGEKAIQFINALESGSDLCPALVLLDLNLPRVDGCEVLQRIRQGARCGAIPVIVFSSSDSDRDRQVAIGLGATKYLKKPSNLEDFLQIGRFLKEMLDETRAIY